MSGNLTQWLVVALYAGMFLPVTVAETLWLVKKHSSTVRKAVIFSVATNAIGMMISSAITFVAVVVMFMLVMGPAGTGSDISGGVYIAIVTLAILLPLLILVVVKRLFLSWLKLVEARSAWMFSVVASIGLFLTVVVITTLVLYFNSFMA